MKTLSLRMKRHQDNAKAIAEFLREQPQIDSVLYPNKGGMLSFRLKDENWVNTFLKSIKLITFAESLGGTESFITYPATQTPYGYSRSRTRRSWYYKHIIAFFCWFRRCGRHQSRFITGVCTT